MTQQHHSWLYIQRKHNSKRHMHPSTHCSFIYSSQGIEQPKCSSTEEWIKMWYIHTMKYYSVIKRNEIMPLTEMWIDLETVTQSEISQKEKNKY